MPKFESFIPKTKAENETKNSLENNRTVIEKLTRKFPKLHSLILAFITTAAVMSAPEFAQSSDSEKRAKIEQKASLPEQETAETAIEKISDLEFKDEVEKIQREMNSFGSDLPKNAIYSAAWDYTQINEGITLKENNAGDIPESATEVFVRSENIHGESTQGSSLGENMFSRMKSSFYILPAERGLIVEGGKIEMQGIGNTRAEALQSALKNYVMFLGQDIDTTKISDETNGIENILTSTTKTVAGHFINKYRIIQDEEVKDDINTSGINGGYKVVVEITGGQFTPEK